MDSKEYKLDFISRKMRGMIEFVKKGMNKKNQGFFNLSQSQIMKDKRGDSESDISLNVVMMVILIVIILFSIGVLVTKGSGAVDFLQSFIRGG